MKALVDQYIETIQLETTIGFLRNNRNQSKQRKNSKVSYPLPQ